jgi:Acetyltransferase (GNAT) domain
MGKFLSRALEFDVMRYPGLAHSSFARLQKEKLERNLSKITDTALAESFCEFAQIPGATPDCFLPRIVSIERIGSVLAAVRLRTETSSPYTPFIEIIGQTYRIDESNFYQLAQTISSEFGALNPLFVRLTASERAPFSSSGKTVDRLILACPLSSVSRHDAEGISVRLSSEGGEVRALKFYELAHSLRPELTKIASLPDLSTIREAREEGLLWEILKNETPIGYVVLAENALCHESDLWISDAIVDPAHTQSGSYTAAISAMANHLAPSRTDAWLCGAIHPANSSSIRAATKLGRSVVMTVHEVPIGL